MHIPIRWIQIEQSEELRLRGSIWNDQFANAILRVDGIEQKIKIRYRGGHTRHYEKKSYEIQIGNRTVHYNAEFDDPSMMRNAISFLFFERIGVPSPRTRHVKLMINGVYRGLYLEIEGVDQSFFSKRKVKVKSLLYGVNNHANFYLYGEDGKTRKKPLSRGYEVVIGTPNTLHQMSTFIRLLHTYKGSRLLEYLRGHVNIRQYLLWLIGAICTGNYDGFEQNYALYQTALSSKLHISPWDYEGTWGRDCYGQLSKNKGIRITGYNGLTKRLLSFPIIQKQYRTLFLQTLENEFTIGRLEPIITRLHAELAPELVMDHTRKHSQYEIRSDLDVFFQYIRENRAYLLKELSSH